MMRYKGGLPPLMICTALRAVMICQACGLDKQKALASASAFCLSMGYKKDIFGSFVCDFELLHNRSFLVKSFAYAHGEIICSVNCEI
ncbi:MAG: hypothetical protein IKB86_03240 [Clostridia bacterium]|nr:hypothetical protein [Clostridia bacterium]